MTDRPNCTTCTSRAAATMTCQNPKGLYGKAVSSDDWCHHYVERAKLMRLINPKYAIKP